MSSDYPFSISMSSRIFGFCDRFSEKIRNLCSSHLLIFLPFFQVGALSVNHTIFCKQTFSLGRGVFCFVVSDSI